jgi:hypothetical protein
MTLELKEEYLAFVNSIESEATVQSYKYALAHYMKFHKISDTDH